MNSTNLCGWLNVCSTVYPASSVSSTRPSHNSTVGLKMHTLIGDNPACFTIIANLRKILLSAHTNPLQPSHPFELRTSREIDVHPSNSIDSAAAVAVTTRAEDDRVRKLRAASRR